MDQTPFPPGGGQTPPPFPGAPQGGPGDLGTWQPDRPGAAPAAKGKKADKKSKKKKDGDNGPTRKVVSTNRLAAIVLGAVAVVVLLTLGGGTPDPTTYVVKAARPLAPLATVAVEDVEAVAISEAALEEDAITAETAEEALAAFTEAAAGGLVQYPVSRGAQIRPTMFTLDRQLLVELAPDERLVSIAASVQQAVGGKLRPGDRVDVLAASDQAGVMRVITADAEVVAVTVSQQQFEALTTEQTDAEGRDLGPDDLLPGEPIPGIYTLKVKTDSARALMTVADVSGVSVYLVYRTPGAEPMSTRPMGLSELLCGVVDGSLTVPVEELPASCVEFEGTTFDPEASDPAAQPDDEPVEFDNESGGSPGSSTMPDSGSDEG